mmetsp:Transcript_2451/g.5718  ORF Transcript_2451/g.5718 Transcript_2451/m.5718 type:complete len:289 (-) Transcript_2451:74-940(-)
MILEGQRNPSTKIYEIKVPHQPRLAASPVITHQSHADLVRYYYTALGCPVWSTFIDALASGILRVPELTVHMARRNKQASIPSAMGHLSLQRKGVRSTNPAKRGRRRGKKGGSKDNDAGESMRASLPQPCAAAAIETPLDTSYGALPDGMELRVLKCDDTFYDGTGAFPVQSRRGIKYILVSTRCGYIHTTPLPSRTAQSQAKGHSAALAFWTDGDCDDGGGKRGACPLLLCLYLLLPPVCVPPSGSRDASPPQAAASPPRYPPARAGVVWTSRSNMLPVQDRLRQGI